MLSSFLPRQRQRLRSHLATEIDGQTIAYCYIRKNACSAFKRMLLDQAEYTGAWEHSFEFLTRHYSPSTVNVIRAARWRIFVYRDPFERAASLFRNKMIMEDGAADFLHNYSVVTRCDPESATFDDFVTRYLTQSKIDPHARSQASHLLPISYNCISTLETLFGDMREIVGDDLANRYFAAPTNSSSLSLVDDPSANIPVEILRGRYAATGQLPSTAALSTDRLDSVIRHIYRDDYRLAALTVRERN